MLGQGVVIRYEGQISQLGPIDEARKAQILYIVSSVEGVRGRCRVKCTVEGDKQIVVITIPWARKAALHRLDLVLRGIGALTPFFGAPTQPILVGLL